MAEPTTNYVPLTASAKMFRDSANDKTIASAVKGTHGSSTLYTTFDNLRTNCNNDLVDGTHGTQGVDPTESEHFRGYPKPTVTMNYEVVDAGTSPDYQKLLCKPTLNNKVGFDIVVNLDIYEWTGVGIPPGTPTRTQQFTISEGNTLITSVSPAWTADGSGKRRIEQTYQQPSTAEDVNVISEFLFAPSNMYLTEATTYITRLLYDTSITVYAHILKTYTQSTCGGTEGSRTRFYSSHLTLIVGSVLYTDVDLTVKATNHYLTEPFGFGYRIITLNTSTGTITGFLTCL
jgi:hypothetical protein